MESSDQAGADVGAVVAAWAARTPSVSGLVLIGSRARPAAPLGGADRHSDWDFHIIAGHPEVFGDRRWTDGLEGLKLLAYAARTAAIGGVPKANAVFDGGEADFVVFPERMASSARWRSRFGLLKPGGETARLLQNLALVIRPGWKFLKGGGRWEGLYRRATKLMKDPRLDDAAARRLADGFVCDYVWVKRKIARGELLAAQRQLHRELAETNLRLLHELRLRRGEPTYPEARRIELIVRADELSDATLAALPNRPGLDSALEKSAATCRKLMVGLVGDAWRWPLVG